MRVNYHIWSGVLRTPARLKDFPPCLPTLVVDVNLHEWALPFSVHAGGPLLRKPGLTFHVGPVSIGWSCL